jgi:hypothetical protein
MKLEVTVYGHLKVTIEHPEAVLHRRQVSIILAAIDAGKLDDLRHFAEHGTLPEPPPVWPGEGAVVRKSPNGWHVMNGSTVIASVYRPSGECPHWTCYIDTPARKTILQAAGEDAQEAMNAAHRELRKAWCL